jgi:protein gp37
MAQNSKISWTDHTWNGWIGCSEYSPGCLHCFAKRDDLHRKWTSEGWGKGKPRYHTSEAYWLQPFAWNRRAQRIGARLKVFCSSLSDWADREVPDEWRDDVFALAALTPDLDWLMLTKRIREAGLYLGTEGNPLHAVELAQGKTSPPLLALLERIVKAIRRMGYEMSVDELRARWPLFNVHMGVSVENQKLVDYRVSRLLALGASRTFLSVEPLLEGVRLPLWYCVSCRDWRDVVPVNNDKDLGCAHCRATLSGMGPTGTPGQPLYNKSFGRRGVDQVIVGGESGSPSRLFDVEWARDIQAQCRAARVPFFMKQLGQNPIGLDENGDRRGRDFFLASGKDKGEEFEKWPACLEDLKVRQFAEPLTAPHSTLPLRRLTIAEEMMLT